MESVWRIIKVLSCWKRPNLSHLSYIIARKIRRHIIVEVNGMKMLLDLNDEGIAKELFMHRARETISYNLLQKGILEKGNTVLDIGANIGYYALLESKLVGGKGTIYAVEPVIKNLSNLRVNLHLNGVKNVIVYNYAFGDKKKKSKIYVNRKRNESSMIVQKDSVRAEYVNETTVDEFLKDKDMPQLIRMDVEGYEYNILRGMKETLKKDVKLLIELHPCILSKSQIGWIIETLKENGFHIGWCVLDPPPAALNSKGKLSWAFPITQNMKRKLGETVYGRMDIDMDKLYKWLLDNKECPHMLFVKNGD